VPEGFDFNNPLAIIGLLAVVVFMLLRLLQSRKQHSESMNGENPQTQLLRRIVVIGEDQTTLMRAHNEVMAREHEATRKTIGDLAAAIRQHDEACDTRWTKARKLIREQGDGE